MTMFDIFHVTLQQRRRFHQTAVLYRTPFIQPLLLKQECFFDPREEPRQGSHVAVSSFIWSFVAVHKVSESHLFMLALRDPDDPRQGVRRSRVLNYLG